VRVSAPLRMNQEKIRVFALSKLDWIRKQRLKIRSQVREKPLKYINQETHYFKGHSYQLKVLENNKPPFAELVKNEILIHVPTGADMEKRRSVLNEWYHKQLMELLNPLIKKVKSGVKFQYIVSEFASVPQGRKAELKKSGFYKLIEKGLIERRMRKSVKVIIVLNEKEACVCFPNLNGEADLTEMFYGNDYQFHEWCIDYFRDCWSDADIFIESKLKE